MQVGFLLASVSTIFSWTTIAGLIRSNTGTWRELPPLLQSRQEHSVAALADRIYVTGGIVSNVSYSPNDPPPDPTVLSSSVHPTNTAQFFDTVSGRWHHAAPLPLSINHGNLAAVNGKLYLLGGLSGTNFSSWNAMANTFRYDPRENRWSTIAPMPSGTARGACAVGVFGDEVFLAGGMTQLELTGERLQASVATVTSYNTRKDIWTSSYYPLPGSRDHVAGAVIGHTFYVTGGRDHGQYNWKNDTWALDLLNPSAGWINKARLPTARGGLASAAVGSSLYTFGGEGNPRNPDTMVFDNVEVYDSASDSWRTLASMPLPRHGVGAVSIGTTIYIPGGGTRISASPTTHFDALHISY